MARLSAAATTGDPMRALLDVVLLALSIYWWIIIAAAIFSWLYAFNVVNARNQAVATIGRMLYQLTEPALRPIRRYVPTFGGVDITPIILLLVIFLIQRIIVLYLYPNVPEPLAFASLMSKERTSSLRGDSRAKKARHRIDKVMLP
jgi:YggT family protein